MLVSGPQGCCLSLVSLQGGGWWEGFQKALSAGEWGLNFLVVLW